MISSIIDDPGYQNWGVVGSQYLLIGQKWYSERYIEPFRIQPNVPKRLKYDFKWSDEDTLDDSRCPWTFFSKLGCSGPQFLPIRSKMVFWKEGAGLLGPYTQIMKNNFLRTSWIVKSIFFESFKLIFQPIWSTGMDFERLNIPARILSEYHFWPTRKK